MQELQPWLAKIQAGNAAFREEIGSTKLGLFSLAAQLLAAPRLLGKRLSGSTEACLPADLQWPWLPRWPALKTVALHDSRDHAWTERVREAREDIREELASVREAFARARYDSDFNPKRGTRIIFICRAKRSTNI